MLQPHSWSMGGNKVASSKLNGVVRYVPEFFRGEPQSAGEDRQYNSENSSNGVAVLVSKLDNRGEEQKYGARERGAFLMFLCVAVAGIGSYWMAPLSEMIKRHLKEQSIARLKPAQANTFSANSASADHHAKKCPHCAVVVAELKLRAFRHLVDRLRMLCHGGSHRALISKELLTHDEPLSERIACLD